MLSIHDNLSEGTKILRNNYACLQALVNNALTWQSSCVIANNAPKTAKAICPRLKSRSSQCNKVYVKTSFHGCY